MHMGMSLGMSMRQIQRCTACGESVEEHTNDCPHKLIQAVLKRQRHINCARCYKPTVDVNADDFYECRECHTQYTTSLVGGEKLRETFLLDYEQNDIINVRVMNEPGRGEFPMDWQLETLSQELKRLQKKNSRKRKKS